MATTFGTPVDFMNIKQLRVTARNLGLAYNLSTTKTSLVTAIKAA